MNAEAALRTALSSTSAATAVAAHSTDNAKSIFFMAVVSPICAFYNQLMQYFTKYLCSREGGVQVSAACVLRVGDCSG